MRNGVAPCSSCCTWSAICISRCTPATITTKAAIANSRAHPESHRTRYTTIGTRNSSRAWERTQADIARRLLTQMTDAKRARWSRGTPDAWAMESWSVAKRYAYGPLPVASAPDYYDLPEAYVSQATAVTAEQLSKAGVRLAWLLNRVLH